MTETIRWVTTPPCSCCAGSQELARRNACKGCERLYRAKKDKGRNKGQNPLTSTKAAREARNAEITALRKNGMSYGAIARLLKIPRASVQSVMTAGSKNLCG